MLLGGLALGRASCANQRRIVAHDVPAESPTVTPRDSRQGYEEPAAWVPAKQLAGASRGQIRLITFPIPLANGPAHLSTTPRWCGCRDPAFSHLTELQAHDHVERV
jgi:hypothetical protein